jgi:cytochrome oxidase Cu insertion factor (SCO1/SenC/PrrC family)
MIRKLVAFALVGNAQAYTIGSAAVSTARAARPMMAALQDFSLTAIDGSAVDMSSFKGKPVLILNVASL